MKSSSKLGKGWKTIFMIKKTESTHRLLQNGHFKSVAKSATFGIFTYSFLLLGELDKLNRSLKTVFGSKFDIMSNLDEKGLEIICVETMIAML